ncbi:hypothetical protein AMELA_G00220360 [Ameiurus melas]|uniref:UBP-type domain-containing protein n=1 Tax=Ameiurus melas TaxID=219545 RepID=A0A7J6A4N2_AMEME|nr:hypothetical protein AMELA_G00220360 [Ameiurus melas]
MRLKDPFSLKASEMTKRSTKPKKPREEDSSDEVSGLTCQHVSKAVELNSVKKAVTGSLWSVCSDCMRERDVFESEQAGAYDILVCLKCGFQGCGQSERQHSVKHQQAHHSDSHCINISLSTWKAWCFECNEELSTHCNKKALAQTLDFLQKHSAKSASGVQVFIGSVCLQKYQFVRLHIVYNRVVNSFTKEKPHACMRSDR